MPVICNICGGHFSGAGPGPKWPHDTTQCSIETPPKLRERISELEMQCAGKDRTIAKLAAQNRELQHRLAKAGISTALPAVENPT